MRTVLRLIVYLVLMVVVGFFAFVVSSMSTGEAQMAESAPDMAESMPAPSPAPTAPDAIEEGPVRAGPRDDDTEREPADPFAAVDDALSRLKQANIAFNTPDELTVGKSETVQLLLSMKESVEQLKAAVTAKGARDGAKIEVSSKMDAKLTGAGFDISPVTPETQVISPTAQTEWKWEVEPVSTDAARLHLTLSAHVTVDGEKLPRVVKTFERTMNVKVNWASEAYSFATGNWEWLWTTLLVPIAGEVLRRRKKNKKGGRESKDA